MRGLSTVLILMGFASSKALNSEGATDCSPSVGEDCELRVSFLQHQARLPSQGHGRHAAQYSHPAWIDQCKTIYLDVGSNIGVQVEKLYEPERFPGALVLPSFERIFGPAEERRRPSNESGLCALGFEPSPLMYDRLAELEADYQSRGWFVHFYRIAAAGSDGVAEFDLDRMEGPFVNHWGAKLVLPQVASTREGSASAEKVNVPTVDFSRFLEELTGYGGTIPFMKMDIEGAEWETLTFMLEKSQLCDDFIQEAFIEVHEYQGNIEHWRGEPTFETLMERIKAQECNHNFTSMSFLDDETYYDGKHFDPLGLFNDESKFFEPQEK